MGARSMIVVDVRRQDVVQMADVEDYQVIQAFMGYGPVCCARVQAFRRPTFAGQGEFNLDLYLF